MKLKKPALLSALLITAAVSLSACHQGPVEKAGKKVDSAVEKASDTLQNKGPMQKAGEKVDEATGN